MATYDSDNHHVVLTLVYDGPEESGKSTSIRMLHQLLINYGVGKLLQVEARNAHTVLFDFFQWTFHLPQGHSWTLRVFSAPAHPIHHTTRVLFLNMADALIFVGHGRTDYAQKNARAWREMLSLLQSPYAFDQTSIPITVQLNHLDYPLDISEQQLSTSPFYHSCAHAGSGVIEPFQGSVAAILKRLFQYNPTCFAPTETPASIFHIFFPHAVWPIDISHEHFSEINTGEFKRRTS